MGGRKVIVELSNISSFSISEECKVKSCSNDSCPRGCRRYTLVNRPGKPIWHVQTSQMRASVTQSSANKQPKVAKKGEKKAVKAQSKPAKVVNKPAAAGSSSSSSSSSSSGSSAKIEKKMQKKPVKDSKKAVAKSDKGMKLEEINVGKKASAYPWADVQKQKQKDKLAVKADISDSSDDKKKKVDKKKSKK